MNVRPNPRPPTSRVAVGVVVLALMGLLWVGTARAACSASYTVQSGDTLMAIARRCGVTLASLEQANPQIANPRLIFPGEQITMPGGSIIPITGQQAALTISPTDGQPGTSVEVAGSAFPANSSVSVTISEAGKPPVFSNTVSTDASGGFSLFQAIPTSLPASGIWVIRAGSPTNGGPAASASFQVVAPSSTGTYTTQPGDTLAAIAGRFNTTVLALLTANPTVTDPNQITPGMQIFIPGFNVNVDDQTVYIVKGGDDLTQIAARQGVTLKALEQANQQIVDPDLIFAGTHLIIPGSGLIPITGQQAQVTLAPASGPPSTLVTISGSNFPANASLNLTAGAQGATPAVSTAVTADRNGSFTGQLMIPPATPGGIVWLITVASATSGGPSATAEFQVTAVTSTGLYMVQAGDTLGGVASRFGTTLFGLLRANPDITDPNRIAVGQQIYIPGSTVTVNGQNIYIVKSGDTLRAIAMAQSVGLTALEQANPQITDPGLIFPGDHVILP